MWADFQNSFTNWFVRKCSMYTRLPPHLRYVATLPCESRKSFFGTQCTETAAFILNVQTSIWSAVPSTGRAATVELKLRADSQQSKSWYGRSSSRRRSCWSRCSSGWSAGQRRQWYRCKWGRWRRRYLDSRDNSRWCCWLYTGSCRHHRPSELHSTLKQHTFMYLGQLRTVCFHNDYFLSASLYFSKRDAYWDRLCCDVVGCQAHCGQTVHPRPIVTMGH